MNEIANYINNDFQAIDSNQSVSEVQCFFEDINFSHFPVLEEGMYIGCIAIDDLETFDVDKKIKDYRYALEGFFVREKIIWLDVLEVFAQNHANLIPVLNDDNLYVGYYKISNIIKFFYETPILKEKGAVIIVEKDTNNYSMGQVVQIIESCNGKILGVFISNSKLDKIEITIKIAIGSTNEIIQSFRRYEYEIVSHHEDDNYLINLKERSDYLDKYLNI